MATTSMGGALVLHPDGTIVEVHLKPGVSHLALLYEQLGCDRVDCVALTDRLDMWIDDEGLYTQPVNPWATLLARHHGLTWQPYHGPVLLCSVNHATGESVDLTRDQLIGLLTHLADTMEVP